MKTNLSDYDNSWYSPGAGKAKQIVWFLLGPLVVSNPFNPISSLKVFVLKLFGATIGNGVMIKPGVKVKYPWHLTIGNHCWIGEDVWIDNLTHVAIGDNCCLSQGAMLLTGNHNFSKSSFDLIVKEIVLEEGVWIGAKSVVCPGVTCFSHSVLSVGSVATKNLEAFSIYQGNPAIKVKDRVIK